MSINGGMDKEDVVHIYNGILLSHRKERNSAICRHVNRPRDCHTERSKSEREKYRIISLICGIQKNGTDEQLQSRNRDTDVENKLMYTKGGRGSGMNWEIGIYIYTLVCIKQITNENLLYSTGNSTQCSVVTKMGRKSKKQGIYVYVYLIHFAVQQKQHCKATILQ